MKFPKRKIHYSGYTHGSIAECGLVAYSPEHIKYCSWKGVNCKRCLNKRGK